MRDHSLHMIGRLAGTVVASCALWVSESPLSAAPPPTVRIAAPKEGAVVYSGQNLIVTVDVTPLAFQKVFLEGGDPITVSAMLTAPPYGFRIWIPLDSVPGTLMFNAVGVIRPGVTVDSDAITIDIERPDSPRKLNPNLRSLYFEDAGEDLVLAVVGIFDDGSEIALGRSTRTTFASDNTAVATVNSTGVVTAGSPGSARITITNGNATVAVPVVVEPRKAPVDPGH